MDHATTILPAGQWDAATARDSVTLDYDERHRRRRRYVTATGAEVMLDLPEAQALRDGDGLTTATGVILVCAAPEPLVEISAAGPAELARLAWHLGNRHLPTAIGPDRLLIRDDHVIVAMLEGLGATLRRIAAPFDPEGGAYGEHNRTQHQHHAHDH